MTEKDVRRIFQPGNVFGFKAFQKLIDFIVSYGGGNSAFEDYTSGGGEKTKAEFLPAFVESVDNSELFFVLPEDTQFPYTLTEEDKSKLTKALFIIATSNSGKKVAYAKTINVTNGYKGYWINTENAGNTAVLSLSETIISAPSIVNFGLVTYIAQTLNDKQKTQARTNIDAEKATIVENVKGVEVTLDVKGGRKYMCGELTSLTINSIEKSTDTTVIYFTSGATPSQFVYPEDTPVSGWDQPEANKIYLICVFNGNLSIEPYE